MKTPGRPVAITAPITALVVLSAIPAVVSALVFLSVPADAQQRPSTTAMTCAQARGLIEANGAMVLSTGAFTYDRYVRDGRFCERLETTTPAWVATRDDPQCFIGYRCITPARQ